MLGAGEPQYLVDFRGGDCRVTVILFGAIVTLTIHQNPPLLLCKRSLEYIVITRGLLSIWDVRYRFQHCFSSMKPNKVQFYYIFSYIIYLFGKRIV